MLRLINREDIAQLWENLTQAFGHKFISNYGIEDNGVWYEVLQELTILELEQGLKNMLKTHTQVESTKKEVWPPNAKEFYLYCLDGFITLGIPAVFEAYCEAQSNLTLNIHQWSHAAVFYAMLYTGSEVIKKDLWKKKIPLYKKYYLMFCQLAVQGQLPLIPSREGCKVMIHQYKEGVWINKEDNLVKAPLYFTVKEK